MIYKKNKMNVRITSKGIEITYRTKPAEEENAVLPEVERPEAQHTAQQQPVLTPAAEETPEREPQDVTEPTTVAERTVAESKKGGKKQSKKKQKKKAAKRRNLVARILVLSLIFVLLIAAVYLLLNLRPMSGNGSGIDDDWKTPEYLREKTISILVCGIDDEEGRSDYLTDVIIVCNIDLENQTATLLQIPRDTYVGNIVPYSKINGIYNWGLLDEDGNPVGETGIAPLVATIYDQFALPIDNYALITMESLRTVIDILGGIEVTIDTDLVLNEEVTLTAGTHLLNGSQCDLLIRSRNYEDADIARMNVQRYFLAALLNRLLSTSASELLSLATELYPYVETDFTINEMLSLAMRIKDFSSDSITMIRVPGEGVREYGLYGVDVFSVHKAELAALLNTYMRPHADDVPASELGVIEIQNLDDKWDNMAGATLGEYAG